MAASYYNRDTLSSSEKMPFSEQKELNKEDNIFGQVPDITYPMCYLKCQYCLKVVSSQSMENHINICTKNPKNFIHNGTFSQASNGFSDNSEGGKETPSKISCNGEQNFKFNNLYSEKSKEKLPGGLRFGGGPGVKSIGHYNNNGKSSSDYNKLDSNISSGIGPDGVPVNNYGSFPDHSPQHTASNSGLSSFFSNANINAQISKTQIYESEETNDGTQRNQYDFSFPKGKVYEYGGFFDYKEIATVELPQLSEDTLKSLQNYSVEELLVQIDPSLDHVVLKRDKNLSETNSSLNSNDQSKAQLGSTEKKSIGEQSNFSRKILSEKRNKEFLRQRTKIKSKEWFIKYCALSSNTATKMQKSTSEIFQSPKPSSSSLRTESSTKIIVHERPDPFTGLKDALRKRFMQDILFKSKAKSPPSVQSTCYKPGVSSMDCASDRLTPIIPTDSEEKSRTPIQTNLDQSSEKLQSRNSNSINVFDPFGNPRPPDSDDMNILSPDSSEEGRKKTTSKQRRKEILNRVTHYPAG